MSTREHLIQKGARAVLTETDIKSGDIARIYAGVVLDQVLPLITKPEQLKGVPELSLLTTETRPVATIYQWVGGALEESYTGSVLRLSPDNVITDEGALTIVWMP